ncbi:MAG TPA: hypothetical protein VGR37_20335 [Longimicrobiaceae bacterium]|nr:hypothetical protein [Longimicrobiaceae bacterium]
MSTKILRASGALLLAGGAAGIMVPVLHPAKDAGYYAHAMTGPSHLLLLAAVVLVSLGLPGACAAQPERVRGLAAAGAALVWVANLVLDGIHGLLDGAVLPVLHHAQAATGVDPVAVATILDAGPLGILFEAAGPVFGVGAVMFGTAIVRGRAMPRAVGLLVATGWLLMPVSFIFPAIRPLAVALPYVAFAALGVALLGGVRARAAAAVAVRPALGAAA